MNKNKLSQIDYQFNDWFNTNKDNIHKTSSIVMWNEYDENYEMDSLYYLVFKSFMNCSLTSELNASNLLS